MSWFYIKSVNKTEKKQILNITNLNRKTILH